MKVACLIIAAGEAKRFGFPKQILPWKNSTILGTVIEEALNADFSNIFVVLGAHFEKIYRELRTLLEKTHVVKNNYWQEGMFSSIKCGLKEIEKFEVDYILMQLGDMPFINSEIFNKFIQVAGEKDFIVAVENNRPAHPYMFSKKFIHYILSANFNNGMRDFVMEKFEDSLKIPINRNIGRQDIDTWEIYKKLKKCKNYIDK